MSKIWFDVTRELIAEKKYSEARAMLKTIDHPKAREWEAQLDKIDPPPLQSSRLIYINRRERYRKWYPILIISGVFILSILVLNMAGELSPPTPKARNNGNDETEQAYAMGTATAHQNIIALTEAPPRWTQDAQRTATKVANLQKVEDQLLEYHVTEKAFYQMREATYQLNQLNLTSTPSPTILLTAVAPNVYFPLDQIDLLACPQLDCAVKAHVVPGKPVTVVGIVRGESSPKHGEYWYQIEVAGLDSMLTVYAYTDLFSDVKFDLATLFTNN